MESLALAKKLDPEYCSFSIIMPLPGTGSYQLFKDEGLFLEEDWDAFNFYGSVPAWRTYNFSPQELLSLQRYCMTRFYTRPSYLAKRALKEVRAGRLGYQIRNALTLLKFILETRLKK